MISPRPLRSSLVALLGAGALVLACSADDGSGGIYIPRRSSGNGGGTTSTGSGSGTSSSTNGATSGGSTSSAGSGGTGKGTGTGTGTGTGSSGGTTTPTSPPSGGAPAPVVDAGSTTAPSTPAYAVAVDNASPSVNLADSVVVTVTITPQSWSGAVALTVTGLPADVTGTFDDATVQVAGSAPATAKLTLTSVSTAVAEATPFTVVGTVGETTHDVAATLTVKPSITLNIPVNADAMSSGFGTVTVKAPANIGSNPLLVNIVNRDSTPHEVHADGPAGFNHGKGTIPQGQADTPIRKVTAAGTYKWHLHDNPPPGGPADSVLVIQ